MTGQAGLYLAIKDRAAEFEEIKTFGLFNNQFEKEEQEASFQYPALFIDFEPYDFKDNGGNLGTQTYKCEVVFYLGFQTKGQSDIEILSLKQRLFAHFHGFSPSDKDANIGILKRDKEKKDNDHDNVQVYETTYSCMLSDYDADNRATETVIITPNLTPNIVTEIT